MKTDQLIDLLARNAGAAPRAMAAQRLVPAAALGFLLSAAVALTVFQMIPAHLFLTYLPWTKLAYCGALVATAGWLTARLSRPAAATSQAQMATIFVVALMAAVGAVWLWLTPAEQRMVEVRGHSWLVCPWLIIALSLPALAATLWAVRGLAPTQMRRAGFAAGLLAGAAGACGYALVCTESSPTFVALWYTLGIVLTGAIGAALGPRVLRW